MATAVQDAENNAAVANGAVDNHSVNILEEHGINTTDIQKLAERGIYTVEELFATTKKHLLDIKGITEAKVEKLRKAAKQVTGFAHAIVNASELSKTQEAKCFCVSTGSTELDALLGGGFPSGCLNEIYGEYRTGKSQVCMTMAVTAQTDQHSGRPGKVFYVDTEGGFRASRIEQICARFGFDAQETLDNIMVLRCHTTDNQQDAVDKIKAQMEVDESPYSLVIIDSITALYRVDYCGRGELAARQNALGKHLSDLKKLADIYNLVVVYTNQVVSDCGGGMSFVSNPIKPIGGNILGHASTNRLQFRKGRDNQRIAKIIDSPFLCPGDAIFSITEGGVDD